MKDLDLSIDRCLNSCAGGWNDRRKLVLNDRRKRIDGGLKDLDLSIDRCLNSCAGGWNDRSMWRSLTDDWSDDLRSD